VTNIDRWNRIAQRPHTRIISVSNPDGESITREIQQGGAYDPGPPLSTPAQNTREYRRAVARTRRVTPAVAPRPASVTPGPGQAQTGPDPRQTRQDSPGKPRVAGPAPGARQRAAVTGPGTMRPAGAPVGSPGPGARFRGTPGPPVSLAPSQVRNNVCALDQCDNECNGIYCSNAHRQKAYRIRKAKASVERIERQELAKAKAAVKKRLGK
jgi:hypothetical protein